MIEKLDWDSDFFGIKIGKLIIHNEDHFDPEHFIEEVKKFDFKLVYIFKYNSMLTFEKLSKLTLNLIDIQLTMSMKFNKDVYRGLEYELKNDLSSKEKSEIYKITDDTAVVSRFYNEPLIGNQKTMDLYRKWIDNALNRSFSDGLFYEKDFDRVTGFHIIKTDRINKTGYFTLTGVNKDDKRKGLGRKLWFQSFGFWANESEIEIVKSPFSLLNLDSLNFHLKMGFNKVEELKYIYHFNNSELEK